MKKTTNKKYKVQSSEKEFSLKGELKIMRSGKYPKYKKPLNVISKSEVRKNPRKYISFA